MFYSQTVRRSRIRNNEYCNLAFEKLYGTVTQKMSKGLKQAVDRNIAKKRNKSNNSSTQDLTQSSDSDDSSDGEEYELSDNDLSDEKAKEAKFKLLFTVTFILRYRFSYCLFRR